MKTKGVELLRVWQSVLLLSHFIQEAGSAGYCSFPEWLRAEPRNLSSVEGRKWITRTEYDENKSFWTRQREVKVKPTEIIIRINSQFPCVDEVTNETLICVGKKLLHRLICLAEEPDNKFRVQIQRGKDEPAFTCLRFVRRNDNVIQMFYAKKSGINEDRLCHGESLQRDPWPWISANKVESPACPIEGGFDFRSHLNGQKKMTCRREWRPSRLESECIHGEGLQIYFPQHRCSIFGDDKNQLEYQFYCWGSWIEEGYRFIVMGPSSNILPQYILRVPVAMDTENKMAGNLYFSPVSPLNPDGSPPSGVTWASLDFTRSDVADYPDPGTCYDESEKCEEFAKERKCVNQDHHEFANFCKKSCGLCGGLADFAPSAKSECQFPDNYIGEWTLYERQQTEQVTISAGQVNFSRLGNFVCKGRHWERNLYKMYSVYTNGCRPRYTCMNFRRNGNLLLYRLSRSTLTDNSFNMCEFKSYLSDDGIGMADFKIIIPKTHTQFNSCGIGGLLTVNATFPDGVSCTGTITDWDDKKCKPRPFMSLYLHSCLRGYFKDFQCEAHSLLEDGSSILITTSSDLNDKKLYECWLIRTYIEGMPYRPWSKAFLVNRGQCGGDRDFIDINYDNAAIAVQSFNDKVDRSCKGTMPYENPWKTAPEEPNPHLSIGGHGQASTPRTQTLPMYLHDIITKAPVRKPTKSPSDKSRTPRKENDSTSKAGNPQPVQGNTSSRVLYAAAVLFSSVLVTWL